MGEKRPTDGVPLPDAGEAVLTREQELLQLSEGLFSDVDRIITGETDPAKRSDLLIAGLRAGDDRHVNEAVDIIARVPASKCDFARDTAIGLWALKSRGHDEDEINALSSQLVRQLHGEPVKERHVVVERLLKGGIVGQEGELRRFYSPNHLNTYDDHDSINNVLNFVELLAENGMDVLADGSPYGYMRTTAQRVLDHKKEKHGEYVWPDHVGRLANAYAQSGNVTRAQELIFNEVTYIYNHQAVFLTIAENTDDAELRRSMEQKFRDTFERDTFVNRSRAQLAGYYIDRGSEDDIAQAKELMADEDVTKCLSADAWAMLYFRTGDMAARGHAVEGWKKSFGDGDRGYVTRVARKDLELGLHEWDDATYEQSPLPLIAGEIAHFTKPSEGEGKMRSGLRVNKGWAFMVLAEHLGKTDDPGLPRLFEVINELDDAADRVKGIAAAAVGLRAASRGAA